LNKYYQKFLETPAFQSRDQIVQWYIGHRLQNLTEPRILVIGAERNLDPGSRAGDGWLSFYFGSFIYSKGRGRLVIVDRDAVAIENCKIILADFIGQIDINFIHDTGSNWVNKEPFDLIYLDGPDNDQFNVDCYELIDRSVSEILCDDANGPGGKCDLLRQKYPDYQLLPVNHIHEMLYYPRLK
jgi:hypothetical protein